MAEYRPFTSPTTLLAPDLLSGDLLGGRAHALGFSVMVSMEDAQRVVNLSGELDLSVRSMVYGACVEEDSDVVVEMSGLTFMDCAGYGSLVEAGLHLEEHGHSLVMRNQVGQPAAIMGMFSTAS